MRICILGATGLVGRETLELCTRAWPEATFQLYASRDQELTHQGKTYPVKGAPKLEEADAEKGDLAFVALDDEHSKRYVPPARARLPGRRQEQHLPRRTHGSPGRRRRQLALGEPVEPPTLAPARDPPFFKSQVIRRRLGEPAQAELFDAH